MPCDTHNDGKAVYISEPGLYQLIFSSRLELAENFRSWVFEDVLPSLRKTGEYEMQQRQLELEALKQQLALKDETAEKLKEQLDNKDKQLDNILP